VRLREEALRMVSNPIRIIGYTAVTATTQAAFGDLDAAEAKLVQAERHLGQGPNSRAWSRMADNMTYRVLGAKGNVELRKGRYAEAEQLFRSALSTALRANATSIRDVQNGSRPGAASRACSPSRGGTWSPRWRTGGA